MTASGLSSGDLAVVETQYIQIVFPVVRELFLQALALGPFFVGFGMIREVAENSRALRSSLFWQRLLLLGAIIVYSAGVIMSYEIWRDSEYAELQRLSGEALERLADLTLVMIPIDLTAMLTIALMFAIIALKSFSTNERYARDLRYEVGFLLLMGCIITIDFMAWFLATLYFAGDVERFALPENAGFHLQAIAVLGPLFIFWMILVQSRLYSWASRFFDWVFVIAICGLCLLNYATRLRANIVN